MSEEDARRDKLIALGPDRLADALLELADKTDAAENLVSRLTSSHKEIIKHFKSRLAGLKRSKRFVDWQDARQLAEKLEDMLADLAASEPNPATGISLLRAFFECDSSIFARCDDSSGYVGSVFRYNASSLFVEYARRFDDKDILSDMLLELFADDAYGVRAVLLKKAGNFLDEKSMRRLVDRFWERFEEEDHEGSEFEGGFKSRFKARHWTSGIESLARQLKDPALFEKARTSARPSAWSQRPDLAFLDIAAVYLEAGDPETALERVGRVKQLPGHLQDEMDQLLLSIYKELGDSDRMIETAWRIFRRSRSEGSLDSLLTVIGEEERQAVIAEETATILASKSFSYSDALFMAQTSGAKQAEAYLLLHNQSLNGDLYMHLKPMAESLEEEAPFGASIVYRALLDSILSRAVAKYYNHGVRYLRKLDDLAVRIDDWKGLPPHMKYKTGLLAEHGRKRSFWLKYSG